MKNLDDLTVVIVTYRTSEKILIDCLKSIEIASVKILIIENSDAFSYEKKIFYVQFF